MLNKVTYSIGNSTMHLLHFALIGFATFGWLSAELRPWHLALQGGILISWVGYGVLANRWAHCAITEWHWALKEKWVGRPETESFIDYWLRQKWGLGISPHAINKGAIVIFTITSLASTGLMLLS